MPNLACSDCCVAVPHIFVWGSCFLMCTPGRRPSRPSHPSVACSLTHTTYSHTQLFHTRLTHTQLPHTQLPPSLCVWQAWHLWHWAGSGPLSPWTPRLFVWQAWHLEASTSILCGRQAWHLATSTHLLSLSCLSHPVFTFLLLLIGRSFLFCVTEMDGGGVGK